MKQNGTGFYGIHMIMKCFTWTMLFFLASCTLPEEKEIPADVIAADTTHILDSASYSAEKKAVSEPLPIQPPRKIKKPSGVFQVLVPQNDKMEQTVSFNDDYTFQLQEEYHGKKDSIVMTTGNWSPSDGYIWLYKDQVVRGRYKWKGDTLQYYIPASGKTYSMNKMPDAMETQVWQNRKKDGIVFFGMGNEPFWSIENRKDSLSFQIPEWKQPVQMKITNSTASADSVAYTAQTDSMHLVVTVYPYFCSDGMSDFVYKNRVRVQYNNQVYRGCGVLFK